MTTSCVSHFAGIEKLVEWSSAIAPTEALALHLAGPWTTWWDEISSYFSASRPSQDCSRIAVVSRCQMMIVNKAAVCSCQTQETQSSHVDGDAEVLIMLRLPKNEISKQILVAGWRNYMAAACMHAYCTYSEQPCVKPQMRRLLRIWLSRLRNVLLAPCTERLLRHPQSAVNQGHVSPLFGNLEASIHIEAFA